MRQERHCERRNAKGICFCVFLCLVLACVAIRATARQRIHISSKLIAGEILRYRVETRTTNKGTTTTPIANPEGGSMLNLSTELVVRLDVLSAPAPGSMPGPVRLRATYEKSDAESQTDAVNPGAASPEDQYKRIEGHAVEFTIAPGGEPSDFKGLEDLFPNPADAEPMLSWARSLFPGAGYPSRGIDIGQKWSSEREVDGLPLSGIIWRTESSYLRDEPCETSSRVGAGVAASPIAPGGGASSTQETCAVILTQFDISRHGSSHADATPESYRQNGMRTSGKWSGSGDSLDSISLATGLLVSSTQTSTQDMDYEIVSASSGSKVHNVAHVTTRTEITLLPSAAPKS